MLPTYNTTQLIRTRQQWDNVLQWLFAKRCGASIHDKKHNVTYNCIVALDTNNKHEGLHQSSCGIKWDDEPIKDYSND